MMTTRTIITHEATTANAKSIDRRGFLPYPIKNLGEQDAF